MEKANVQYTDLAGTAALDFHGGVFENLVDYAEDKGIDVTRYNPIGLTFQIVEHDFKLTFLCTDCEVVEQNETKRSIISFERDEDLDSFLNQVKRFNVVLLEKHIDIESCHVVKNYDVKGYEEVV